MRLNSLAVRLLLGAAIWSIAALAAGGLVLSSLFRDHVERSFDARLELVLDALIADIEVTPEGALVAERPPAESLFETPFSGWYWQISGPQGLLLRSRSLWDQTLPPDQAEGEAASAVSFRDARGPEDQRLRVVRRTVILPDAPTLYTIEVAGDLAESRQEIRRFNRLLTWALGLMGAGLIVAMLIQVHYGLAPLRQLRTALMRIRGGQASRLEGAFPAEIAPLAKEINTLLEHISAVVERARTQVGNLAHALKTPLSVLTNEARHQDNTLAQQVRQQASLMRRQVEHHLTRARAAVMVGVLGVRTEVAPVARDLARALEQIHKERRIAIAIICPEDIAFGGEQQDLEEMVGNLLDNGSKWARQRVEFRAGSADGWLRITVDDDGPGLDEGERAAVLKRGTRLDESISGSGLGLAIVRDLVELYHGTIALERSPLGGLRVAIELPLAAPAGDYTGEPAT